MIFQSTLPRRERLAVQVIDRYRHGISIHAPAKGATRLQRFRLQENLKFQSTLPRRERRSRFHFVLASKLFQSTLPRRERQSELTRACCRLVFQSTLPRRERRGLLRYHVASFKNFNPRSREGSDSNVRNRGPFVFCISIHAPAKGATGRYWNVTYHKLFQSTLPRRERRFAIVGEIIVDLFQSTLPRRERHCLFNSAIIASNFNPRSREGSDC